MDLPASVTALADQLRGIGQIAPDPALLNDANVFAAERERIFARALTAVDHASRLSEDGHYFRCDAGSRSILVTRETGGRLNALRNVCIHAGYPVCEAQEGPAERLICPYHGWEYTLDGRLVEPELSSRIDPSRLRLASYPVSVSNGLIFVDPSGKPESVEQCAGSVPAWLADARVARRARYSTKWNWKFLRQFLQSSPSLLLSEPGGSRLDVGPLSWMLVQSRRAVLIGVIPKFAEQSDFQLIEFDAGEAAEETAGSEAIADALCDADTSLAWFDRDFADWYCSLMLAT